MVPIVTQDHNTHIVGFEVQGHASHTLAELHHFSGLHLGQTEHSGDTVSDWNDCSEFFDIILLKKK